MLSASGSTAGKLAGWLVGRRNVKIPYGLSYSDFCYV